MTKHENIMKLMSEEADVSAIAKNTITSPLGGKSDDMFLVTFLTYFPPNVTFTTYRSTCTVNVTIDNNPPKPYKVGPGAPQTIQIPAGTTAFSADATDIQILDPSMSFLCTTF